MPRGEPPEVRIVPLNEENLREAPEWDADPWSCKYCQYWEYPELLVDQATEDRAANIE